MQLDTRIPMMMGQAKPIRFQPESQLESLAAIAPSINAMRQMQAQEAELADAARKRQAFRQFQDEVSKAFPGGVRELAQVFVTKGVTQQHFETGQKLLQMMLEQERQDAAEKQWQERFGGIAGTPTPDQLSQMALSGKRGLEVTSQFAGRYVPVGQNVLDKFTGQIMLAPPKEAPANALVPGAAPAPAGTQPARPSAGAAGGAPAAGRPMSEGELARRRDAVGKEYRNARTSLQNLQDALNSAELVRNAPGLERATGFSGVYLPSFTGGAAAQAQTRLENLRGKITAMGKATAAMSGAIGSIANQEWKILADQIAVIDPVKGAGPMLEQISLLEQQARDAMKRIKDAYEKQFGEDFERFPQFRELPMPAQGAGLSVPRTPAPAAPAARPRSGVAAPASAPSSGGWSVVR